MLHFLSIGIILGLSAGFAPGPLLTLVISETLQHDVSSGIKVAIAPIITDLPIVLAAVFILSKLSGSETILGVISLTGGLFILYMGYHNIRIKGIEVDLQTINSRPVTKGVLANALSPHPYIFWLSVGTSTMNKALDQNINALLAFIVSFYIFLVGSKTVVAFIVGKSKSFLTGKMYIYTMRILGVLLGIFAILLFHDGLSLLQVI